MKPALPGKVAGRRYGRAAFAAAFVAAIALFLLTLSPILPPSCSEA